VGETLRHDAPVQNARRGAAPDVMVEGRQIAKATPF
jgi:cytochrome P450